MMNEHDLMEALEQRAADVAVGPAPVDTMTRSATVTRRRTTVLTGLVAVAAVGAATVGVVATLPDDGGTGRDDTAPAASELDVPPDGFRYVGRNGAAIAVPAEWPRNDVECNGVPKRSTYRVDLDGVTCMMFSIFPADTDAVSVVFAASPPDTTGWTPVEIDGVEALRSPVATTEPDPSSGDGAVTSASVYLPEEDVVFVAESTIAAGHVTDLLDGVVLLDGHVGVPGFSYTDQLSGLGPLDSYRLQLEAAGLEVEVVDQTDRRKLPPGTVVSVSPAPGTLVAPGSTVTVTTS